MRAGRGCWAGLAFTPPRPSLTVSAVPRWQGAAQQSGWAELGGAGRSCTDVDCPYCLSRAVPYRAGEVRLPYISEENHDEDPEMQVGAILRCLGF